MTFSDTMAVARDHWLGLATLLEPDARRQLARLLRAATGPGDHQLDRLRIIDFFIRRLPADHPVRRSAADGGRLGERGTETLDIDALFAELAAGLQAPAGPAPSDIAATIRQRLLAGPSYGRDRVAELGIDPADAALIRLGDRFPAFQFTAQGTVPATVTRVNRLLRAGDEPWGAADWWLSRNAWLGGTPAELLGEGRDDDIAAAAAGVVEDR